MKRAVDVHVVQVGLLALAARALWLLRPVTDVADSVQYRELAARLLSRHIFSTDGIVPSSFRPPLYPAVIAAAGLFTNHPVAAVLILQVILGTLTVVLGYQIAKDVFGETTGALTGLLLSLAPMTARYSTVILTETVFTFLVVFSMWAWGRSRTVLSGVALGLATLTRASSVPYLVALAVYGLIGPKGQSKRGALVVAVVALLTTTPWVLRNVFELGRVTVADAGWGVNLFYGTVDLHRGSNRWAQLYAAQARLPSHSSAQGSDEAQARDFAMQWIRQNPVAWLRVRCRQWPLLVIDTGDYLPVSANKVSFRDALREGRVGTIVLKVTFVAGNALLVLFAMAGAWSLRGRFESTLPLWTFPAYLMAAHLPMYVEPRYGLPLVPFLVILGAEGVRRLWAAPAGSSAA